MPPTTRSSSSALSRREPERLEGGVIRSEGGCCRGNCLACRLRPMGAGLIHI
jgi:hypothetical protein